MFKSVNGGILPKRFTKYSCGFDVFANEDVLIGAGETKLVGLGIAIDPDFFIYEVAGVELDNGGRVTDGDSNKVDEFLKTHYLELHIRSSLRVKGLTSLGTGIIDIDFVPKCKIGKALNNGRCEHFKSKVKE